MGNVLDDITDETIDAHHVQHGDADSKARVKRFYAVVSERLPDRWIARAGADAGPEAM